MRKKLLRLSLIFLFKLTLVGASDKAFEDRIKLFGLDRKMDTVKQSYAGDKREVVFALNKKLESVYLTSALKRSREKKCELGSFADCLFKSDKYWEIKIDGRHACFPSTLCGYYQCMESHYQCSQYGVNYFTDLAFPTCSQYVKNINEGKFSQDGVEWIYSVMVCLQKGLFEECELKGNCHKENGKKACAHIVDFTLKFHPGCYINSGIGICNLKLKDQINIWRTVGPYLTKRERVEAFKVVKSCLKN